MTSSEPFLARARPFLDAGILGASDVYAVALSAPRFGEADVERLLGLAFAARAPRVSHPGVDLVRVVGRVEAERALDVDVAPLPWPTDVEAWAAETLRSPMVGAPDDPYTPFVRQPRAGRAPLLLSRRMYVEQRRLADALAARAALEVPDDARLPDLEGALHRLFPDDPAGEAAAALRVAATRRLALVVGGPGTGKTFSVTRLLAALLESSAGAGPPAGVPLSVALAAPTGKAAARMREAIREATAPEAVPALVITEAVRARLSALEATTLHRLVGLRPDGSSRHDAQNPIPAQLVIVDEVSMVDLTMMRRLLEAVHPDARLVLLGDRDQLASVEAGCVLADLVPAGGSRGWLAGHTRAFTRSRRFESAPDIALIAACLQSYPTEHPDVPARDPSAALALARAVFGGRRHATAETRPAARVVHHGAPRRLPQGARPRDVQLDALAAPYCQGVEDLRPAAAAGATLPGYAAMLRKALAGTRDEREALEDERWQRRLLHAFDHYRVLAVERRGALGVEALEREIARRVRAFLLAGFPEGAAPAPWPGGAHWPGRPLLVTENAYEVGLLNGDVGIVLPLRGGPAAIFAHEEPGRVRRVSLARLPPHEGALAMTVHKSQGSQFDRVALVLAGRASPLQTRELVYTGVTRARMQLAWLGDEDELADALERRVERESGLPDLLAGFSAAARDG